MASARELLSFLLRNGYTESRQTGSHLVLKHPVRKTVVVPVHRGKDLPKGLFLRILKDAGFRIEDFHEG
jgi:predicted RNA binding protein YcfA (HicA-like mRNA interferase family)